VGHAARHRQSAGAEPWHGLAGFVVGFFVFFLVIVASIEQLSVVPANVYGFAMVVAYTLSAGKLASVTETSAANPLILVILSAIAGVILGYLMGQLAGVLKTK
jgi:hypothetical protein